MPRAAVIFHAKMHIALVSRGRFGRPLLTTSPLLRSSRAGHAAFAKISGSLGFGSMSRISDLGQMART